MCSLVFAIIALITQPTPYTLKPIEQPLAVGPVSRLDRVIAEYCREREPGDTNQIIFTVESESDLQSTVTGCTRITGRQFLLKGIPEAAQP